MTWLFAAKAFFGRIPTGIKWAIAAALCALAIVLAIKSYGNARYDAGVATEKAAWEAADARLREKASEAGIEASRQEIARQRVREAIVENEREKINEAVERGESPFDRMDGFNRDIGGGVQ